MPSEKNKKNSVTYIRLVDYPLSVCVCGKIGNSVPENECLSQAPKAFGACKGAGRKSVRRLRLRQGNTMTLL